MEEISKNSVVGFVTKYKHEYIYIVEKERKEGLYWEYNVSFQTSWGFFDVQVTVNELV